MLHKVNYYGQILIRSNRPILFDSDNKIYAQIFSETKCCTYTFFFLQCAQISHSRLMHRNCNSYYLLNSESVSLKFETFTILFVTYNWILFLITLLLSWIVIIHFHQYIKLGLIRSHYSSTCINNCRHY